MAIFIRFTVFHPLNIIILSSPTIGLTFANNSNTRNRQPPPPQIEVGLTSYRSFGLRWVLCVDLTTRPSALFFFWKLRESERNTGRVIISHAHDHKGAIYDFTWVLLELNSTITANPQSAFWAEKNQYPRIGEWILNRSRVKDSCIKLIYLHGPVPQTRNSSSHIPNNGRMRRPVGNYHQESVNTPSA